MPWFVCRIQAHISRSAPKRFKLNREDLHKWEYALQQAACSEDCFEADVSFAADIQHVRTLESSCKGPLINSPRQGAAVDCGKDQEASSSSP